MEGRPGDVTLALLVGFLVMCVAAVVLTVLLGLDWTCDPEVSHCDDPPEGASAPMLLIYFIVFAATTMLAVHRLRRR